MAFISRSDFKYFNTYPLLARLKTEKALLQTAYKHLHEQYFAQGAISPGVEWFLDNFYLVEQTIDQISQDLTTSLLRRLSQNGKPISEGYPKIYTLALECLRTCENLLDIEQSISTLKTYQLNDMLRMAEIWAFPSMLRLGIIGSLAETVERLWLVPNSSIIKSDGAHPEPSLLSWKSEVEDQSADWTSIGQREATLSARQVTKVRAEVTSDNEQIVINCIHSLRTLSAKDWKAFFEEVSRVEEILSCDPANVYASMDFDTRESYRGSIERLASAAGWDETAVASKCIYLANCAGKRETEKQKNSVEPVPYEHIGYYLVGQGRPLLEAALGYQPDRSTRLRNWAFKYSQVLFFGAIVLLTAAFSTALGWGVWQVGGSLLKTGSAILLALIPITIAATQLADRISAHLVSPKTLPKMDYDDGIPLETKTMVVIPAIVGHVDEVDFLLDQIERHYLGNPDKNLGFALLTDFLDAPHKHMPVDQTLLDQLTKGVIALNDRYSQQNHEPFYLFHRCRTWNPAEDCWMGWERKRGKLIEFNRLLNGEETSYNLYVGELSFLPTIRYIITLDMDTSLPRESARRLVATLAHPLNRAVFDQEDNHLVAGYTMLQPRIEIHPASLNHSLFTRIFAGETGLDLYTRAVSDVYMDLFDEGIYVGKGIYEVAAFQRSLDKKIPENMIISHDLLEGLYGHVGLVTDMVFYEDFPPNYLSFVCRLHRWIRGDWQLLPWLLLQVPHAEGGREPSPFSTLDRWRILNNLLYSLHGPAVFGLLIAGWLWLPGHAWCWTVTVAAVSASEYFGGTITRLFKSIVGAADIRLLPISGNQFWRWIIALVFLPFESWICLNAIASTLMRVFITHKHLLRWTTSAQILTQFGKGIKLKLFWRQMLPGPLFSLGVFILMALFKPAALPTIAPLLVVWLTSPMVAWWLSRPAPPPSLSFSPDEKHLLHGLARRTWLYFELCVGSQTNWLPPDNLQEDPYPSQITKTSPTNLGLALLSTLAAADLGYIGPRELANKLEKAFESLDSLPRHNGHFFNWYDIRNLSPVPPYYVSVVDSGNLAACLLVLKQGLKELSGRPVLSRDLWQGLVDTLNVLAEYVAPYSGKENDSLIDNIAHFQNLALLARDHPNQRGPLLFQMVEMEWQGISEKLLELGHDDCHEMGGESLQQITLWTERVDQHLENLWADARLLAPWLLALRHLPALFTQADAEPAIAQIWEAFHEAVLITPRLEELPAICTDGLNHLRNLTIILSALKGPPQHIELALQWCQDLIKEMLDAKESAQNLLHTFQKISDCAEKTFVEMDFCFLFDNERKVFSVGYDLDTERMDLSSYDLLASEARLASLIAIAKNDIPQDHWVYMARPVALINDKPTLLSWGGSLFEYLMPTLLTRSIPGTLLDRACRAAISHHITIGNQENLPWGLSESSCYQFDAGHSYQYRAFGIKELAVNSNTKKDRVVAPYATALALPFQPKETIENLKQLIKLGMLGTYGLYDAIDFTPSRKHLFKKGAIVPIYMTHHQGMIMLSLVNCLKHHIMVRRFHTNPRIQTVELLLWEAPILNPDTREDDKDGNRSEFFHKGRVRLTRPHGLLKNEGLEVELKST